MLCFLLICSMTEVWSIYSVFPFPSVTTVSQCLRLLSSWSVSSLCLCHTSTSPPSSFVDFYWLIQFTIGIWCKSLPRMLVMCLSNLLWWQYFLYLKKEYCGLLGGLTFYRTRHICKSEKKKKRKKIEKWTSSLSCTGHVQTQLCTKGPFLWAKYSSLQLHNFFLVHASGRLSFLGFLRRWFVLGEPICCMGESREILV